MSDKYLYSTTNDYLYALKMATLWERRRQMAQVEKVRRARRAWVRYYLGRAECIWQDALTDEDQATLLREGKAA